MKIKAEEVKAASPSSQCNWLRLGWWWKRRVWFVDGGKVGAGILLLVLKFSW
jgi:hypothetical protein